MKEIYLDNSATTVVCSESTKKIIEILTEKYGNPSSLHSKGFEAEKEINNAREIIAEKLSCDSKEVYFTSGGTESNNIAIFGAANAKRKRGNKIVATSIEHSSVLDSLSELKNRGFEIVLLNPGESGIIAQEQIDNAIDSNTILVTMMMVNNEIGSIQPVTLIKKIVEKKKSPAIVHVDAVQAFGKIPVNVKKINADLLSITAHKIHGPKGSGVLYVSKNTHILPRIFGGEQENKIRPGTQASPLIGGFGAAVENIGDMNENLYYVRSLKNYCFEKLIDIPCIKINSPRDSLEYIINFSVLGIKSETMLHYLASNGIYVSSGSACAKGKQSHVLKNIGLSDDRIHSALRVSFSKYNTIGDVDTLVLTLKSGISRLAKS